MHAFPIALTLSLVGLSGVAPGTSGPGEDSLAHRTAAEETRRSTFSEEFQWELDSLAQIFGDAIVSEDTPPMTGVVSRRLVVLDSFTQADEGTLTAFEREVESFEVEAEATIDLGDRTIDYAATLASPLVDETLLFERDEDDFDVSSESELDAELLEGLRADAWLLALIPDREVGPEDSWTIEADALPSLLAPGGVPPLSLASLEGAWGEVMPSDILAMALTHAANCAQEVDGSVEVTWTETRAEEGRRIAVLDLVFDVQLEADLESVLMALFDEHIDGSPRTELRLESLWSLTGDGRASWDLERGRLSDFEADLDTDVAIEMRWIQEFGGAEAEVGGDYEISGQTTLRASCE